MNGRFALAMARREMQRNAWRTAPSRAVMR